MNTLLPGLAVATAVVLLGGNANDGTPRARHRPARTPPRARVALGGADDADSPIRTSRRRLVQGGIGLALVYLLGPLPVVGAVFAIIAVGRLNKITVQRQRIRGISRDLPEALDLFVLLLEAGVSSRGVVVEMARRGPGTTRPAFAQVADRLDIGEPFTEAIVQLRIHLGAGAVALVDLVTAAHRYGLPMADVVSQLSTEARAARQRRNEALARALPIKLSFPLVVCTLPSFVLLAIAPAVMAALTSLGANAW